MGNTPEPCDTCVHLYYDAMSKEQHDGYVDCKKGMEIGTPNCPKYFNYQPVELRNVKHQLEEAREALRACRVFITPLERQRNWDEYKEDAAKRIVSIIGPC